MRANDIYIHIAATLLTRIFPESSRTLAGHLSAMKSFAESARGRPDWKALKR